MDQAARKHYYRVTADEIRQTARRTQSKEIREDLVELAERYDRLAKRAEEIAARLAARPD